jgi:two-component system nitrate/nitrite response regulator NarL
MSAAAATRFLVVDDHALLREGVIATILRVQPGALLVQTDSLQATLHDAQAAQCDTIVLDLTLPDSQGLATLQAIRSWSPRARIAIVSAHNDLDLAVACIREGACAFVPKQGSLVQFQQALAVIAQGGLYFPRELFISADLPAAPPAAPSLTPRQQEVLAQLLKGCTNPMIGEELGISAETVKLHVSAILAAYGVANRVQLVLACSREQAL